MSNYGKIKDLNGKTTSQYNAVDNAERKSNRTGDTYEHVGQNKAAHVYTTSGSSTQKAHDANEAKRQKIANQNAPVKVFTEEEKKALQEKIASRPAKPTLTRSQDETKYADVPTTCPGCKKGAPKLKGHTNDVEPLTWWHCPSCETTGIKRLPENETEIEKGEGSVDQEVLTKTHPQAFEIYNALSEAKKLKKAFDLIKAKMCKVDEEEPHADPHHEQKEKKAASKIKRTAQQILDMHKEKK